MYYVYVLKSKRDGRYYIGQTNELQGRIRRHSLGYVKSTRNRRPFELVHFEIFASRTEAVRREAHIKKLKGGNGFKRIISPSQ